MKKSEEVSEKKPDRQDTFRVPQKALSRWSDIITTTVAIIVVVAMTVTDKAIAVTNVITMIADDEEKRSARICFGISFSLKFIPETATTKVFSLCSLLTVNLDISEWNE